MKTPSQPIADLQTARQTRAREYFRKLRFRRKGLLLLAVLVPLAVLSLYFHIQFTYTLKSSGKLHLAALAESQRNTIDQFLQERVANIFGLFQSGRFSARPDDRVMVECLQALRQTCDSFIDVGFFDAKGIQIGYAGPFPHLQGQDYSREEWFQALGQSDRDYHISDIYLGFRKKPHFTIAATTTIAGELVVARATLDPEKFYLFLRSISRGQGTDIAIINKQGYYQVVDPTRGAVLTKAPYLPPEGDAVGADEIELDGDSVVTAYAWFRRVPWALVVSQPFRIAHEAMYQVRRIMLLITAVITVLTGSILWVTTDRLLERAEQTAEARENLHWQLVHASKLAAVGELAAGVAHEINNPLAAIAATSGVIRDLLTPELQLEWTPEAIVKELDDIDTMVFRARGIITQLMHFSRKSTPRLVPSNVNEVLDGVVSGLKEREFHLSGIQLVRDYQLDLPEVLVDPDQLGQVFLNLINNAGDAIQESGTITLSTRSDDRCVRVAVSDTGCGIPPEEMEKIFLPFHTTKQVGKGTGLGLSISLSIVESLKGRIEAESALGVGSTFVVVLPITTIGEPNGGTGRRQEESNGQTENPPGR